MDLRFKKGSSKRGSSPAAGLRGQIFVQPGEPQRGRDAAG